MVLNHLDVAGVRAGRGGRGTAAHADSSLRDCRLSPGIESYDRMIG